MSRNLGRKLATCLLCLLPAALMSLVANPAVGAGLPEIQADIAHQLALAGPHDGAYVYDATTGTPLFDLRASTARPPASVEKLYTSATALELLGPTARLTTAVDGVGSMAPGGVWQGNLYLVGGGDPSFGSPSFIRTHYGSIGTSVSQLVTQLTQVDGLRAVNGQIEGDESYLDSLRGEPSSGYAPDPFLEGTLSGLSFDRGSTGHERGPHAPAAYAARQLRAALRRAGVKVSGGSGAATKPAGAIPLAAAPSPTLAELLGLMLPPSDNFFAETLIKDLGARFAGAGTTAAGAAVVTRTIASTFGIRPLLVDGSGLSPRDRTSPLQVVMLLAAIERMPWGSILRSDLAVAGHSGTLAHRMRHTPAAGRCEGKTGTLSGVSNLAGYCRAANGHTLVFALFNDGIAIEPAHLVQDHIAITLAGASF